MVLLLVTINGYYVFLNQIKACERVSLQGFKWLLIMVTINRYYENLSLIYSLPMV